MPRHGHGTRVSVERGLDGVVDLVGEGDEAHLSQNDIILTSCVSIRLPSTTSIGRRIDAHDVNMMSF